MKLKFLERIILIAWLVITFANGHASRCPLEEKLSIQQTGVENPVTQPAIHFSPIDFVKW
jgi:hypothetical protein